MAFPVVCISRSMAAGGELIGQAVAERLDFQYVDEQIIAKAAAQAQVDPQLVAEAEHRQPLLRRILDRLAAAQEVIGPVGWAAGIPLEPVMPAVATRQTSPDDLRAMIRFAIHEVARAGKAVIVAHAASMALGGNESVLRILITASPETRAKRLAEMQKISASDAAAAIASSDRERRTYFQSFYQIKEELPTHYDLVLNTDVLTPEAAVDLIVAAARSRV